MQAAIEEDQIERVRGFVEMWARRMRRCAAEIISEMWHPPATVIGALSASNNAASEEDRDVPYERLEALQAEMVDAAMDDLRGETPWAYWAVCRKHKLGSMGMSEYESRARAGQLPPGMYPAALEELIPHLERKGVML